MLQLDSKKKWVYKILGKDFRAAGICFYNTDQKKILLQKSKRGWEFLGGRVEKTDLSLFHTALRESVEEANGCITKDRANMGTLEIIEKYLEEDFNELEKLINTNSICHKIQKINKYVSWIPEYQFKYGLFLICLPEEYVFPTKVYGSAESKIGNGEEYEREVHWLSCKEVKNIFESNTVSKQAMIKYDSHLKKVIKKWIDQELDQTDIGGLRKWYLERNDDDDMNDLLSNKLKVED